MKLTISEYIVYFSETVSNQISALQQQLYAIAKQRDETVMQLAQCRENNTQYATSLSNLQIVLEQFQQGRLDVYVFQ